MKTKQKENVWNKLKKCYKEDFTECKEEYPHTYQLVKEDMQNAEHIGALKVRTIHDFFTFLGEDYREMSIINIYQILK